MQRNFSNDKRPSFRGKSEVKVCGVNACQALVEARKEDIVRIYITEARIKEFGRVLRWCAENRKAYHIVTDIDLEKIAETSHHEGVCILARQKTIVDFSTFLARERSQEDSGAIVFLENIQNPHNLGAILRVCAHFGVAGVLVPIVQGAQPSIPPAVYRAAEGGMESVDLVFIDEPVRALRALRNANYQIFATSSHGPNKQGLYDVEIPQKSVFMFGSESEGLSPIFMREAQATLTIPGSRMVESLNVACAASSILGEYWRLYGYDVEEEVVDGQVDETELEPGEEIEVINNATKADNLSSSLSNIPDDEQF